MFLTAAMFVSNISFADNLAKDYCDKVVAKAAEDAALLLAPSVQVQGIKLPTGTFTNAGGFISTEGYTVRASFLWFCKNRL
jgi:hypothetical protein